MSRPLLALALGLLAAGAAPAQYREGGEPVVPPMPDSLYRPDQPEVLAPPPRLRDPAAIDASRFRAAYARARRPRIIVFWNRELSDEVSSRYENYVQAESRSGAIAAGRTDHTEYDDGHETERSAAMVSGSSLDIASGTRRTDGDDRRSGMVERADWKVEGAFLSALAEAGAVTVDRAMAMRTTGLAQRAKGDANMRAIETSALTGKAEILMEVLQTPDPSAPLGWTFRIQAKDIRSGRVLATIVSTGQPRREGPGRFVAGPNGYEREAPRAPGASGVGRRLADETLGALARNWG